MAVDTSSVSSISAAAATARNLFRRAKISGADFAEISSVVRPLHTVLKHLHAEAEDPDSLLNASGQESSVYARQLTPIIEDTDFTLKQLDTILEKYGSYPGDFDHLENGRRDGGNSSGKRMEDRERDMIALIRTKLANQKTNIDIFLDTVQLHNPTRQHRPVDLEHADGKQMNAIKDKVDIVAARLFQRRARSRASGDAAEESEEEMWQQFWAELVKEGFSGDVLRKHKGLINLVPPTTDKVIEVLRAYIRELDSNGLLDGKPPSVRGLLDQRPQQGRGKSAYAPQEYVAYPEVPAYASHQPQQYGSSPLPPPVAITPASYPSSARGDIMSPKEMVSPNMDNEKFPVSVKLERRQPDQTSSYNDARSPTTAGYNSYVPQNQLQRGPPPPPASLPVQISYERYSSDSSSESGSTDSQQLALISTRDIMDLDQHVADNFAARMGGLHLTPAMIPTSYGVSPGTSPSGRYMPPPGVLLPLDHSLSSSPQPYDHLAGAPRYVPPVSAYGASPISAAMPPPPPYVPSNTHGAAPIPIPSSATTAQPGLTLQTSTAGQQRYSRLAPDSKGSDIPLDAKWTRIKRALVSPEVLTKAGVRYEARPDFVFILGVLTKDEIAAYARKSAEVRARRGGGGHTDTKPRPAYHDEEKRGKDGKRPPRRHSDTESDTDSEDVIWDESDTSDSDSRDRPGAPSSTTTNKYIPPEYRRRRTRRDSASSTLQEEPEAEDNREGEGRKGHNKAYPVIVDKASPATTVPPKPILKNRNENHVRFEDGAPREVSPGELERERERRERRERRRTEKVRDNDRRRRERERDRDRDHERGDRERERERERERDVRDRERDKDRDVRDKEKDRSEKEREKERERERERERDRHRERNERGERDRGDHHGSNSRSHRDRDRDEARDRRRAKKSVWGETLGAVGIGGAAASLLSVLTEAAAGF